MITAAERTRARRSWRRSARSSHGSRAKQRRRDRRRLRLASLPLWWRMPQVVREPNTLFSRRQLRGELRGHVQRLAWADEKIASRMADPRLGGIRAWEYGMLLAVLRGFPERRGWSALDIGSGRSTLPFQLVRRRDVERITTLDLPTAFERRRLDRQGDEAAGVRHVHGSMTDLPFGRDSFDLVTCISAIEHLDGFPKLHAQDPDAHPQLPYERYLSETRRALESMMRVLRPGGWLYLTTDAYLEERQSDDAWNPVHGVPRIWSAYHYGDIDAVFLDAVRANGLEPLGPVRYDRQSLLDDPDRAIYRGRYFTTFCLFARKCAS
jgi:SAM-dependent methyltransferase